MTLPEEVIILGEPTQVKYKKIKHFGLFEVGEITINNTKPPRIQIRSLVHEMGHGIFQDSHDPDQPVSEEDFARMFEQGVACLFRENPDLVGLLAEELGGKE